MIKYVISTVTATGDTTKTLIDTVTLPQDTKRILSAGGYAAAAATLTSGEAVTGILELESDDIAIAPCQLPLDCATILTSGALAYKPSMYPINMEGGAKARIKGSITMDMAQTGGLKGRFVIAVEV